MSGSDKIVPNRIKPEDNLYQQVEDIRRAILSTHTVSLPRTEIADQSTSTVLRREIQKNERFLLFKVGVVDDNEQAPSGLEIQAWDLTNGIDLVKDSGEDGNTKLLSKDAIVEKDGRFTVSFRMKNTTGTKINAAGFASFAVVDK